MKSLKIVFTFTLIILILFSGGCATKKKDFRDAPSGGSAGNTSNTSQGVKAPASVSGVEEFVYEFDVMVDVDPQKMAEPRPDYPESVPPSETRSTDTYGQQSQQSQLIPQQQQQSQLSPGAGSDTAGSGTGSAGIAGSGSGTAGSAAGGAAGAVLGSAGIAAGGVGTSSGLGSAGTTAGNLGTAGSTGVGSGAAGGGTGGLSSTGITSSQGSAGNAAANWGSGTQGSASGTSGSSTGSAGTSSSSNAGGVVGIGGLGSAGTTAAGSSNDYVGEYTAGFKAGHEAGVQSLAGTTAGNLNSANSVGTAGGAAAGNQSSAGNINGSTAYVEGYTDGFAAARRTTGSGTTGNANAAGTSTASNSAAGFSLAGAVSGSRAFGSHGGPGGRERRNTNLVGPGSVNVEGVMDYIKIRNRNPVINEESTRRIINSYIDEAVKEDVNYDFAIAQMLYWTAFLTHKQRVESNNLAGLQSTNEWRGTFPTAEEGVQAHIQHLRGYSHRTLKDQNAKIIDPRWNHISDFRGTIKNFEQIYPRWSASTARYRRNIILILNDMYRYSDRYSNLYR